MKTSTTFLAMICFCAASAQEPATPEQLAFANAIELWEDKKPDDALNAFNAFLKEYPHSPMKPRAHYNVGYINHQLQRYSEAAAVFREILRMDYNEQDENSLMEPYALYKHNSAVHLAEISLEVKDWKEAERYIHTFDKVYPYQHFCGNEWAAYDIMKATMDARLHEGQGKIDEAVQDLLPHMFYNGLAWNEEAVSDLIALLRRNYSAEEIKTELEHGLTTIKIVSKKKTQTGILTLFGTDVPIEDYNVDVEGLSFEEGLKKIVRENRVFVELTGR